MRIRDRRLSPVDSTNHAWCGSSRYDRAMTNQNTADATRVLLGRAAQALKASGAREVYVFGSAAKGTTRPDSDLDLGVSGLPPHLFFHAMAQAHRAVGRPLDLIDLDDDTPFVRFLRQQGDLVLVG